MHNVRENLKFFGEFLRSPKMVGSVIPTSPYVVNGLLSRVNWSSTKIFVEYGPGMGTITKPILARLRPDARLIAIDTNPNFVDHLRKSIADPRLDVVRGSAADVEKIVTGLAGEDARADHIVSGLPFSTLPEGVGDAIVQATYRILRPDGCFLVYQYSGGYVQLLRRHFEAISLGRIWRNIPPCVISAARKSPV